MKYVEEISKQPERYLRNWVLFDSDAKRPKIVDKKSKNVVKACGQLICYHQLRRREIENYLPLAALWMWTTTPLSQERRVSRKEITSRRKRVTAFKKLSVKQRHHFNMKDGFDGDFKVHFQEKETETEKEFRLVGKFYDNVSDDIRKVLSQGFGKNIGELFQEKHFPIKENWLHKDKSLIIELETMLERLLSLV